MVIDRPRIAEIERKRVFIWHVHGSYCSSLFAGGHVYYVPVVPDRGPDGRGRARTYPWPDDVIEVTPVQARSLEIDVLIVQRPHELELAATWLGRTPGRDLRTIYLEHNAPQGRINEMRHPVKDRDDLTVVHVSYFNRLFWDCGTTPVRVVEHGIIDPGYRYTGELPHAAVAINEARRRARVTGTDLLEEFGRVIPLDLYGIDAGALGGVDDPPQSLLHAEMPRRRVYLHTMRWTSLGLTLLEAMHLGMPVVALATTEVIEAVPPECGTISTNVEHLCDALRRYAADPVAARNDGRHAREYALQRYGLDRFLSAWDALFAEVTTCR